MHHTAILTRQGYVLSAGFGRSQACAFAVQLQTVIGLAAAAGKPLIVDEFNIQRPISQRNEGLQLIYSLLQNSSASVAGELKLHDTDRDCFSSQLQLLSSHSCTQLLVYCSAVFCHHARLMTQEHLKSMQLLFVESLKGVVTSVGHACHCQILPSLYVR